MAEDKKIKNNTSVEEVSYDVEKYKELKNKFKVEFKEFRNANKAKIQEYKAKQQAEYNEAKAQGMSKIELRKLQNSQWLDFQQYVQDLQYEEYLKEVADKEELDKFRGINKDENADADVEQGNPVSLWFKHLFRDIKVSIQEKPSIIFGLLSCVTGILIGFKINVFMEAANGFPEEMSYVGIFVFVIELVGMINIVNGFGMCKERRLKSVVGSIICSLILLVLAIAWVIALNDPKYVHVGKEAQPIVILIICVGTAIAGAIGSIFTYDKHYVKVKR